MAKEKNLNNKEALKTIGNYISYKYINKEEWEEKIEFDIEFNLMEEKDGKYTLTCNIEINGEWTMSFPIGWNYTERGVTIKANQLINALMSGEYNRGTCTVKSAGWKKIIVADMFKDLEEECDAEENNLEECQECDGTGSVEDSYDDMYGGNHPFYHTCDNCEGEGKVRPEETPDDMHINCDNYIEYERTLGEFEKDEILAHDFDHEFNCGYVVVTMDAWLDNYIGEE